MDWFWGVQVVSIIFLILWIGQIICNGLQVKTTLADYIWKVFFPLRFILLWIGRILGKAMFWVYDNLKTFIQNMHIFKSAAQIGAPFINVLLALDVFRGWMVEFFKISEVLQKTYDVFFENISIILGFFLVMGSIGSIVVFTMY